MANGALAITLEDAKDQPIFASGPGETPLWQSIRLKALFPRSIGIEAFDKLNYRFNGTAFSVVDIPNQDWVRVWMEDYKPVRAGDRLWVCPSWCNTPDPSAVSVTIDPGLAFGSGTHPTTKMCLKALDQLISPGMRVVDYGCGSGILGISALKLGAAQLLAIDNDSQAITATLNNAKANNIDFNKIACELPNNIRRRQWLGSADLVVANILAEPLIELAEVLKELMDEQAQLLLAGSLSHQMAGLQVAYEPLTLVIMDQLDDWVLLSSD